MVNPKFALLLRVRLAMEGGSMPTGDSKKWGNDTACRRDERQGREPSGKWSPTDTSSATTFDRSIYIELLWVQRFGKPLIKRMTRRSGQVHTCGPDRFLLFL